MTKIKAIGVYFGDDRTRDLTKVKEVAAIRR